MSAKAGFTHERGYEGETNTWLTPRWLLDALGPFDLDPCAAPAPRPWDVAAEHYDYTQGQDGLLLPWDGRVFCNPPYGPHVGRWMRKLSAHGQGVALVFARVETADWQDAIFPGCSGVLFLRSRVRFCRPDGTTPKSSPGAPSALISFGAADLECLRTCSLRGRLIQHVERTTA